VQVRSFVLESCLHDNGSKYDLRVAVVMPDHVHIIFRPLIDYEVREVCSLATIMDAIKGASAHKINKCLGRNGRVWHRNLLIMCCVLQRGLMRRSNICWRIRCGCDWLPSGGTIRGCGKRHS